MAVDEHDELPEATQREAELQRQIDDLQGQILKEKLNEHSKQLEQSAEKLSQLESENLTLRDENQALNAASNKKHRFRTQVRPMPPLETPNSGTGASLPTAAPGGEASTREKANDAQTYDGEDSDSEPEPDEEASDGAARAESPMIAHLHQISDRLERLPGVAPPIRKSNPDSYADTPFTYEITLIEMPRKFSFPSIRAYNGTTDPDDHVAQYRQRMLAVALPKGSREATMCKGFGSTLTGPALQWYINLPSRSIASFAVLSDKFVEQFASGRDLEKTSDTTLEESLSEEVFPIEEGVTWNNLNPASPNVESSWPASERQNAKSKQIPVVVLPRVPKEVRTSVPPRAHRGDYNFKEPPGSKKRSPDPNLRVPTWPQKPNTILAKRIEPLCSLGRIGVVTSLKNLRVPMRPQGPSASGLRYDLRI
ncbi:hypothetical protein F2Q68_00033664 [Brassica cretica]|uniref:Retrotransposon gag domain-containing protein n=1 Tax=Brassica cretica TaxID=69181 RepID=A0A8S9GZB2_BRACR|nr:hypothetical protein F2Q68_00033664 [Brassica cretica]